MPKLLDTWSEINNLGLLGLVLFMGGWVTMMEAPTIIHLQMFAVTFGGYCTKIGLGIPKALAEVKAKSPVPANVTSPAGQ